MSRLFIFLFSLFALGNVSTAQGLTDISVADTRSRTSANSLVPEAAYPAYYEYLEIMQGLANRYPDRCKLENWGTLPSGRQILTLRLTEGVTKDPARPQVLCTAAMHGDETAGYWLLLRLAEYLLSESSSSLLSEIDLYINPLANPDGAFRRSNYSLRGAIRGNANQVDLNRNYPDPDDGAHPDGHEYQPETQIFMQAARDHSFDLAINLHGGAEVFNYPWDTYRERHPDTKWWRQVSRDFATRAQQASGRPNYFNDRQNGITNGHDWYPIAGSRQDYMNYYHHCREATLEVSNTKQLRAEHLPNLWTSLSPALLGYIREASFGLQGFVTDRATGAPLKARVEIPGHDARNTEVYTAATGDYYRYLAPGEYQILFSAPEYVPQWQTVTVRRGERTVVNVALEQLVARRK